MNRLRRIAVWVHETPSATFRWVLTEGFDGRLRDVRSSEHEFISFAGALDEGADALKNMCDDCKSGPRLDNDLVLDSELASRRHAALLVEGPFVTLTDLGSRNGTFVNGSRVKSAVLVDRDLIEIGDCLLRFIAFDQETVAAEAMSIMVERGGQLYQQRQPTR